MDVLKIASSLFYFILFLSIYLFIFIYFFFFFSFPSSLLGMGDYQGIIHIMSNKKKS